MTSPKMARQYALTTRVALATAAVVGSGMLLAVPSTGAESKSDLLLLSRDGVHFATTSPATLFRSDNGYVPGESRQDTLWIRNGSTGTMRLSLGVRHTGASIEDILPRYLRLQATAQVRGTEPVVLPAAGGCTTLIHDRALAAGAVLPLTLDLSLQVEAPNPTKNQQADFDLIFVLQESGVGHMVVPCSYNAGSLPVAGAVASVAIAGGTAGAMAGRTPATGRVGDGEPGNEEQFAAGLNPNQAGAQPLRDTAEAWPLLYQLQSNVEANVRSPWPWLVLLGAGVYAITLTWRRSRTT